VLIGAGVAASTSASSAGATAPIAPAVGTAAVNPTTPPQVTVPVGPLPPVSGVGWTAGEDELLRTLNDQHAGLTMMILKTRRPIDEVVARLAELGIDAKRR